MGVAVWSLVTSASLISKIYFPREAIPLSVVGAALIDLGIGIVTVFGVALFQGVDLKVQVLGMVPALAILVVWTAAVGVFTSALAVFIRDVTQIVQLILRVGFFATPVMYEPSLLPSAFAWTASVNPLAVAIEGVRDSLLCGAWPRWGVLFIHLALGVLLLMASVLYMRSVESRMADVL
jgi:ABC-type polysaccharide/polyol phosphate export permease